MSKVDTDNQTLADDPTINLGVPDYKIDIKVVLMSLREEIITEGIRISNREFPKGTNVVIPSIVGPFDIWFENGYIYFRKVYKGKLHRFPCEFEDGLLSERLIDLICAYVEYYKLNEFKL